MVSEVGVEVAMRSRGWSGGIPPHEVIVGLSADDETAENSNRRRMRTES